MKESKSSCGTDKNSGYPYCCKKSSHTGNGWGWENSRSCKMKPGMIPKANGNCPRVSCPKVHGKTLQCGCEVVGGLGSNKKQYINAGAKLDFLASAMLETTDMSTNYPLGDRKTGDAFNAGACKQNWGMMRKAYKPWRKYGASAYKKSIAMNKSKALDVKVYYASRKYFGKKWFAGHRNGATGLQNPNTRDIKTFVTAFNWTVNQLKKCSACRTNDVRFWVNVHAI
eukprot:CAMPEP_0117418202 /NCGR_PEP_ID=MMETSP0758-20121206/38_1 /TAXON_ID=63605 /ORGANISM="Percolomonas cosmopolitus, Strain AE-1 (ATCC 50343)" /LENGTH=225 /DNA_ID=CAMNT_0005198579 /DNA_START=179 /DNA_END=856 /DNA_ORIENTATION=-